MVLQAGEIKSTGAVDFLRGTVTGSANPDRESDTMQELVIRIRRHAYFPEKVLYWHTPAWLNDNRGV